MGEHQTAERNEGKIMEQYTSATLISSAANFIMDREETFTHTYRTYVKLRENGPLKLRFWHSNAVDSTWDKGEIARAGMAGGPWVIEAAFIADGGKEPDGTVESGTQVAVTFGTSRSREVAPGETFWSDDVSIDLPEGHFLAFTWTIRTEQAGKSVPFNVEQMLVTAYDAPGNHANEESAGSFTLSDNMQVLPAFIGYEKQVDKRLLFFGDSITQGVRTAKDGYEYWAARIGEGLGAQYGAWNIGAGWARAYDAATNTAWLNKLKQQQGLSNQETQIVLALGVNDLDIGERSAEQLLSDLQSIISVLKEQDASTEIILFTVPPFNFVEQREQEWRKVNETIRTASLPGVSRVFDIAAILSQPAPNEHQEKREYMSNQDDPHPNGLAGKTVAEAFLQWYR
ncbi:SGNH/GDSL hydrolase family protein [Paenibacillus puldeungensis]|uniref:SGNH/GDSL hydrolase family protein n=1 Tax=Paenibacillus puldeungensis TaxID=696536 RepID=A0ABW3RT09_9BACL